MEVSLYQKILESNLLNFIIMVSILTLIFKKANLGSIIDKMAEETKNSVTTSIEAAKNAMDEYKKAKKSTRGVEKLKQEIIDKAEASVKNIEENSKTLILKEEAVLDKKLEAELKSDYLSIKKLAVNEILDEVRVAAEEEILKRLNGKDGDAISQRLIEKSISELDNLEGVEI